MKQKSKEKPKEQEPSKPKHDELEGLRQQIESLQAEKEEIFGKLQRVGADYANFQKRVHKQVSDSVAYEKEKMIETLLPALDNFEHTLQNAGTAENVDVLVKGIQIIYGQMLDILKSHGVEQIKALGENFDPALHQAMMQQAEPQQQNNIVLEEFQKGYKLNSRVIRPSKVVVNKLPGQQAVETQERKEEEGPEEKEQVEVEEPVDLQEHTTDEYEKKDTE